MPRVSVSGIESGRAGRASVQLFGLKELRAKLSDMVGAEVAQAAAEVVAEASDILYGQVVANAKAVHLPRRAFEDIYTHNAARKGVSKANNAKRALTGLVGIRKRGSSKPYAAGYSEWRPGRQVGKYEKTKHTRTRGKDGPVLVRPGASDDGGKTGAMIGENVATMWELGTTKNPARPFFSPAVLQTRGLVMSTIAKGYSRIIAQHAKA